MSLIRLYLSIFFFTAIVFSVFAQTPVTFSVGSNSGFQGDDVCIDITVEDFNNISSLQWVLRWDPKVACLICPIDVTNSALNIGGANGLSSGNFNCNNSEFGYLNLTWIDGATTGVSLADGDILFTACFGLCGDPCDSTSVAVDQSGQIEFEVIQVGIGGEEISLPLSQNKGFLEILSDGFLITEKHCSSADNEDTGSITFSGSGGNGPYSWMIMQTGLSGSGLEDCESTTVDNLAPGNYTIIITDASGTVRNETIEILSSSNFPYIVTLDGTDPTCFDRTNGKVFTTDIVGGEAPYIYEWSTFEFLDGEIKKLGPGDYSLTVSDVNGCTTSASYTLVADTIKLEVDIISNPTCDGSANGLVSISVSGGTPFPVNNYNFDIDGVDNPYFGFGGPINPFSPGNLPEGTFVVVASDNAASACFSDPVYFTLVAGSFADLEITVQDPKCFGECNGEVLINVADTGNFSFMVDGPNGSVVGNITQTTFDINTLCAGDYNVEITDILQGCTLDTTFVITEPFELMFSVLDSMGPGCGGGDGMITFETIGGQEPYEYLWNDTYNEADRSSMGGGDYQVTVTDDNNCTQEIVFHFGNGGDIGLNAFVSQAISCFGSSDGSVSANVSATEIFTFSWKDESGMSIGNGMTIDNLPTGYYYVTATDGECTDTDTVFVVDGQKPTIVTSQTDPTCFDSNDGTLIVSPIDGTTPFMYEWTQPPSPTLLSTGAVLLGGAGIYSLNIIDAQGCTIDTLLELLPPTNIIELAISNIIGVPCFDQCSGQAQINASGGPAGTGNYTYFISNISTPISGNGLLNINQLCAGDQWIYAIDGICNSDTVFFNVPDAEEVIHTDQSIIQDPACFGGNDGMITLDLEGGNSSSYSILWINENIAGPTLTGLEAGTYIAQITDGNNCISRDTIILATETPLNLEVNLFATINLSCFSGSQGKISVVASGGNPGELTYNWTPSVSATNVADDLGPGIYDIMVTDSKGCTAETSYELISAPPIIATIPTPEETACFGGQSCLGISSVSGGVGNIYTFTINNGPLYSLDTCINLFAGPYLITVFDSVGCSFDTTLTINQPTQITVDVGDDITIDLGASSDPVSAFIVSELDIDTIIWSPNIDIECNTTDCQVVTFSPNATTNYTVTVIDENGCLATDDLTVFVDLSRNAYLPNIFSPNGDNNNDLFQIATGFGVQEVTNFIIYDRWGNKVYNDEKYMPDDSVHAGWDGTYNNRDLQSGVFVYFAEVLFEDGVIVRYKGDVTLIR
ncbi:MAG: gliding motility-associated C-terminal domain-containing protein [Saprospiraceae bacterium]